MLSKAWYGFLRLLVGRERQGQWFYKRLIDYEYDLSIYSKDYLKYSLDDGISLSGYKLKYIKNLLDYLNVPATEDIKQRIAIYKLLGDGEINE